jgi:diguanylate cyclase (GGDEF)-like protein
MRLAWTLGFSALPRLPIALQRSLRALASAALLLCALGAEAARDPLAEPRFVPAPGTEGIVDGLVSALAEDEQGLIWVGTSTGLVRYDGYQTKPFPVVDAPGVPHRTNRFLRALQPGGDGTIWVGSTSEGLSRLDTRTERWLNYRHDPADPHSIPPGSVQRLARTPDGGIWVGLLTGLARVDPATGRFTRFGPAQGLAEERIGALTVDRAGHLWVGTWKGLARLRQGATRFENFSSTGLINSLAEGPDGRIWAGMNDGRLVLFDPEGQQAPLELPLAPGPRASAVLSLAVVGDGEVWVGRVGDVEVRSADGALLHTLKRERRMPWTLNGTDFHALVRDRAGTLWVGGYGGGLQRYRPDNDSLWVRAPDLDPASPLAEPDVRSVLPLRSGEVWLGTQDRGIAVLDRQLRTIAALLPDARFSGLIAAMAQAADGSVWAGTDTGRLYRFDAARRLVETRSIGQSRVRRLLVARDGRLWIGAADGLHQLAPGATQVTRLALLDGGRPRTANVNTLLEEADGAVWVGGDAGLFQVAHGTSQRQGEASGLPQTESVLGLLRDAQGVLWVDTNAGLFQQRADGRFERPAAHHVLPEGSFGANLLADRYGRLWTVRGLFDPTEGSYTGLHRVDGVDIGTGWFRAYAQLADGRMLFGGSTGLLVVEPERFKRWDYDPPVVATELRVDGQPRPAALVHEGLRLAPGERSFSVQFAALDYSDPRQNHYRFRLIGYDTDWTSTNDGPRVASYANLPPGRYTLEIRGSNRLGDWSSKALKFDVVVAPAWWQTWWARTGAMLLAILAVAGLVQWRTRALARAQAVLEARVQERTAELEAVSRMLEASSFSDPLTGLHNRRFLMQHIDADVALALRRHEDDPDRADGGLVFMLVDVDHFKQVNDRHGHSAGDAVLVELRRRMQTVFRESDHLVRWGGEEFLAVARDCSREAACELAERMRRVMAERPFTLPDGQQLRMTCSIGFVSFPLAGCAPQALSWSTAVDIADSALYQAKRNGRNRWVGVLGAAPGLDGEPLTALLAQPATQWLSNPLLRVVEGGEPS